jgi:hypothetical protein
VTLTTLGGLEVASGGVGYKGTRPLQGDWDILRFLGFPGLHTASNKPYGFGIRLATEVPSGEAAWALAERLWFGDAANGYLGDGLCVPGEEVVTVEGPFRIRPRGRRLVVRFNQTQPQAQTMALTFVLQQL